MLLIRGQDFIIHFMHIDNFYRSFLETLMFYLYDLRNYLETSMEYTLVYTLCPSDKNPLPPPDLNKRCPFGPSQYFTLQDWSQQPLPGERFPPPELSRCLGVCSVLPHNTLLCFLHGLLC